MKKTVFLLVIALAVFSCEKDKSRITAASANSDKALIDNIAAMTDQFTGMEKTTNPTIPRDQQPLPARIAHADIDGAVDGSQMGNTWYEKIIFGILQAELNSIGTYFQASMPVIDHGPITEYSENQWDFAGQLHYQMMNEMMDDPTIVLTNNTLDYSAYEDYALTTMANEGLSLGAVPDLATPQLLQQQFESYNPNQRVADFVNAHSFSSTEKQILISYLMAFDNTASNPSSGPQFITYSIQIEHSIITSNLSQEQKARLLSVMSTARCATGFYGL